MKLFMCSKIISTFSFPPRQRYWDAENINRSKETEANEAKYLMQEEKNDLVAVTHASANANANPKNTEKQEKRRMHSICIPRVDVSVSRQYIFSVFCNLKIGFIEKIMEFPSRTDPGSKRVIIFVKWNKSETAEYIQSRFDEDKNVKVVHMMPWYWICVANRK